MRGGSSFQYALAGLLKTHGVRSVLLGEGADQVFNRNFYDSREPSYLTNYNDNPYELGAMVVLKKSILMLDAFGITGLYPFISRQMQKLGAQVMEENGTSKTGRKRCAGNFLTAAQTVWWTKNPEALRCARCSGLLRKRRRLSPGCRSRMNSTIRHSGSRINTVRESRNWITIYAWNISGCLKKYFVTERGVRK